MKRLRGTGQVEPVTTATGEAYRVRLPGRRGRRLPGVYTSPEHAEDVLAHALERLASRPDQGGLSLGTFGEQEYERRELAGMRSAAKALSRWRAHVVSSPLGGLALRSVTVEDVIAFVDSLATRRLKPGHGHGDHVVTARAGKPISPGTAEAALVAVRVVLGAAADRRLIKVNPATGVRLPRDVRKRKRTEDPWTYLLPDEQTALLTRAPRECRSAVLIAAVALGTGLRQGEQWNLELRDVDVDGEAPSLLVRWGSKGKPPKSGKIRRVPLLGIALVAMREWLDGLPRYAPRNPEGLAFPTQRGCRRQRSKLPRGWDKVLKAAGLSEAARRHDEHTVRWHDLRHTCASSLVAGWWGRTWALQEVRDVLGHSSVVVTERYAHLSEGVLAAAAAATPGAPLGSIRLLPTSDETSENQARHARFERATFAFGGRGIPESLRQLEVLGEQLREQEERYLLAVHQRNRFARSIGVDLAEASKAFRVAVDAALAPPLRATGARS